MIETVRKLYLILDARERRRAVLMFLLVLGVAIFEVIGVASILPFIAVLANPELVETNEHLARANSLLGFSSTENFLFFLGLMFFFLLMGSLVLRAVTTWARLRFTQRRNHAWSCRLLEGYLRQPYEWYLNRNSSNLATTLLGEISQVVTGSLNPTIQMITHAIVAMLLLALLFAVDPALALTVFVVIGALYGIIFSVAKRHLLEIGRRRRQANRARFKAIQEGFGGIKDVKVLGLERGVLARFERPSSIVAGSNIRHGLISEIPSSAVQGLLFGGMLLALLYLMRTRGDFQNALPVAALYAFAGYRLMPAVRGIFGSLSQIRFSQAALDSLYSDFETVGSLSGRAALRLGHEERRERIPLKQRLALRDVTYIYPNAGQSSLEGINLEIAACTTVGLVGTTGAGKTTAVDIILGLLQPSSGELIVDGDSISADRVKAWQRSLGYVPQQIFLSDNSVAANIAFGTREKDIDQQAVEQAARIANLHDFVVNELPQGYATLVGERGVRLSGGQRQRIGIARAMYSNPDVLILDEATSALDNLTEQAVMEAVQKLGSRKTIILIAHRLSTVRHCDCIFLLEHGKVVAAGSYDALVAHNASFRAMAEIA